MNNVNIRYALVGAGSRCRMFLDPILSDYEKESELVAIADPNKGRLEYHQSRIIAEYGYQDFRVYHSDDFDRLIEETRPDVVIVTTVDAFHHKYIIRAMELGCDVVTEKPMTIDAAKCNAIMDTIENTGKNLRVAFNYRWSPGATKVREVIQKGTIGEILHVDMEYWLNTSHGADYFRRWHREKNKSGGLIVHKATHHFDLVNWWINAIPESVYGIGNLAFYGKTNAELRGETVSYDRYMGNNTAEDPFAIDIKNNELLRQIYVDNEKYDGYVRDMNVFSDGITIEDSMSLLVKYKTGTVLTYSLNAFLPREGFRIAFNGTKGRIEYEENHSPNIVAGSGKNKGNSDQWQPELVVYPLFDKPYQIPIDALSGGHGGGDILLQRQIFARNIGPDPFSRDAGHQQGAASVLVGAAANQSFLNGQVVKIDEICPSLTGLNRLSDLN